MKFFTFIWVGLIGGVLLAQTEKDSLDVSAYTLFKNDSLIIDLEEVLVLPKLKFNTRKDQRYYYWFRKKVLKAYPYARLTAEKLGDLDRELEGIPSRRKKKRYVKKVHKYLEEEFRPQLKKLTRTEGNVLIKLVHRETGTATFGLIKKYRSGWKAFWYNATANLFKMSLKDEYDPANVREDYMIEDILQRAWRENLIVLDPPKIDYDYAQASKKWDFNNLQRK